MLALLYGCVAIVAVSGLWSCSKDEDIAVNRYAVSVEVSPLMPAVSKTAIELDNSVTWSASDKLGIMAVSASGQSATSVLDLARSSYGKSSGKFIGELEISEAPQKCWFVYPSGVNFTHSSSVKASFSYNGQNGLHVPYLYGGANYSQAGISAALHHVGGMLRVLLLQDGVIKSITVEGNNSEKLTPYIFTFPSDGSVAGADSGEMASDAVNSFSVNVSGDLKTAASGLLECYITMPPVNFTKGFRLIFTDANGNKMYKSFNYAGGCDFSKDVSSGGLRGGIVEITVDKFEKYAVNSFVPTVTVNHVFEGGKLTGTNLELTKADLDLSGSPMVLLLKWGIEVYNISGNLVRRIESAQNPSSVNSANKIVFNVEDSWVYLPNGSYTIKPYVVNRVDGEKMYVAESNIVVPRLDVSLLKATIDAKTSYSYYLAGDLANANKEGSGSSIYNVTIGVNISDEILKSSKYTVKAKVEDKTTKIKIDEKTEVNVNLCEKGGLGESIELNDASKLILAKYDVKDWRAYTIASSVEFDGVTAEAAVDVHVTGLPYKAVPPTKTGDHPWADEAGRNTWNADNVELYYSAAAGPEISSPVFHIPADINVSFSTKIVRNDFRFLGGDIYGPIKIFQKNGKDEIYDIDEDLKPEATLEGSYNSIMSVGYTHQWFIRYQYIALGPITYVYYFNLDYR